MNKTLTGILAAALLWAGNPVPCRGEASAPQHFGLNARAWLETTDAAVPGRSKVFPAEVSTLKPRLGEGANPSRSAWSLAVEVVSENLGVWSISHYILRDPWSDISPETIRQNFTTGLVWDQDGLLMNCLAHPYHGSSYFNVARSSGLSFWESVPFALGGSAMWETCLENEPASRSDLIFTTFGGVYYGELFYRLTSRILDGRSRGLERAGRELAAFILNPARGLQRLFGGDMFRYQPPANDVGGPFKTRFFAGRTGVGSDPFVALTFRSGDPFNGQTKLGTFDFFVHRSRLRFGNSPSFTQSGYGYLGGTRFGREDAPDHVLGLFLNFDFHTTEAVRLGASSLTGGLVSRFQLGTGARLETALQFGATLLGGFDNPQVRKGPRMDRDYNFGSGAVAKVEAALDLGKWGTLRTNFAQHYLVVLEGTPGVDQAAFLEASYEIPVYKSWTVGVEVVDVRRLSNYRDVPDIRADYSDYRMIAGVRF
ncbi:MAG: DUF3943 domain-containing protein [Candidatus Aminicenantes bacterium]|nr:DUF3943 domain-containing protein [Candidatus Aminicenantes bacterium]